MHARVVMVTGIMVWILTASGAIANPPAGMSSYPALCAPVAQAQRWERTEVVDESTGAEVRLTARQNGALQVLMSWPDFEFQKVVQPNGDYHLRLRGRQDLVLLIRTGDRLRVTRSGQTATLSLVQPDANGLDTVQQVLAGSRAVRLFRALYARLSDDTLGSVPGMALDSAEALVDVLQGNPSVGGRRRAQPRGRVAQVSFGGRNVCYDEYETEVNKSWGELAECVDDVKWFPGGPEVCALVWAIKVESAWFQFVKCSAFPLKNQ
jgi:hypothetical protein